MLTLPSCVLTLLRSCGLLDDAAACLRDALHLPALVGVVPFCLLPHQI
jgi:hypothetical protein